jgi:hypothetical protein
MKSFRAVPLKPWMSGLALAAAAVALMTVLAIASKSFWGDELYSIYFCNPQGLQTMAADAATPASPADDCHPPLYFSLLKVWVLLFGNSEAGLRLFQGLQGLVLLGVCLALFRRSFPGVLFHPLWLLLLTAGELWLCLPMLRYYALTAILGVVSTLLFLRWLEKGDRLSFWGLAASYTAQLYTDYPSSVIIAGHLGYLAIFHREKILRYAKLGLAVFLLFLPWVGIALRQVHSAYAFPRLANLQAGLPEFFLSMAYGFYGFLFGETILPNEGVLWLGILGLAVVFWAVPKSKLRNRTVGLWAGIVLSGLVSYAAILAFLLKSKNFIYVPSHNLYLLPFVYLLLAAVYSSSGKTFRVVLVGTLLAVNVYGGFNWYRNRHFINPVLASPWKQMAADLKGEQGSMAADESGCLEYYEQQSPGQYPRLIPAGILLQQAQAAGPGQGQRAPVYLLRMEREFTHSPVPGDLVAWLDRNGRKAYEKNYLAYDDSYKKLKSLFRRQPARAAKFTVTKYTFE